MNIQVTLQRFIEKTSIFNLLFVLIIIHVVKCGIWVIPSIDTIRILSENPFVNPYQRIDQYLFANWLWPFIGYVIGASSLSNFILLGFFFSLLFILTTIWSLRYSLNESCWRKAICLYMCLPVSWTHLYWIGYDSLTLALLALTLANLQRPWVTIFLGIALGLQHVQQGALGIGGLIVVILSAGFLDRGDYPQSGWPRSFSELISPRVSHYFLNSNGRLLQGALTALLGVIVGSLILMIIIKFNRINFDGGRNDYFQAHKLDIIRHNAVRPDVFVYGLLEVSWIFIFLYIRQGNNYVALTSVLFLFAILTFFTIDVTRVFAVISYPAIAFCLLYDEKWLSTVSFRVITLMLIAWTLSPWIFDWEGKLRMTVFPFDVELILHSAFDIPRTLDGSLYRPFQ